MSLWKIAWRSIQQRSLASLLTTISMALGVTLVVAVLVVNNVVHQAFHRGGAGYDLIVGPPKGSNLELVLSSVFYIGQPMTTLPYDVYLKLKRSEFGTPVKTAVPICLGDTYKDKRVVGTTAAMFDLEYEEAQGAKEAPKVFNFTQGRAFQDEEADWFTAVAGATAAQQAGLKLDDSFRPTHDAGTKTAHQHGAFKVVGILKPTGTPNDNVLFVNIEGFYRVGGHSGAIPGAGARSSDSGPNSVAKSSAEKPHEGEAASGTPPAEHDKADADHDHDEDEHLHAPIPDDRKQVSAVLVCTYKDTDTRALAAEINKGKEGQAAIPAEQIAVLLEKIVGSIDLVLLVFAVMIVLVAGIGIMVSIYNSMNDRRHEIAIMRALGAQRITVLLVILLESILLSLGGGLLGLALGHGLLAVAGPWIAERVNLPLSMLNFQFAELWLVPALIMLASIVGFLPALSAYRTDVGKSLIANP